MSAGTAIKRDKSPVGSPTPRIKPPSPARSDVNKLKATADEIGISFIPWQLTFGRYVYALGKGDAWLYPEVAGIVSRQQGKTKFLVPHIVTRLEMGRRMLHAAQTRELPRMTFNELAPIIEARHPRAVIRRGTGQESIELPNGGLYRISAATSGGPRGMSVDDLLIDEGREIDPDFVQAAEPTTSAALNPQILWLSNAGSEESVALNTVRARRDEDRSLAYLEWSASPELAAGDITGWLQANPAIGHFPAVLPSLERAYASHKLSGTMAAFETERLCRWVASVRETLVAEYDWISCRGQVGAPARPSIGVSMEPHAKRAAVALAWREGDGIALRILLDVHADNINPDDIGVQLQGFIRKYGVRQVAYDPMTDGTLIKYTKKGVGVAVSGQKYANASSAFANAVKGTRLTWQDADGVTDDLTWTSRKPDGEAGGYHAVRADDARPITAALAAIRAVGLATGPRPSMARVL